MARLNTFFLSPDKWPAVPGESVLLDGTEARHMLTVLRTDKDQTVRLFDGRATMAFSGLKVFPKGRRFWKRSNCPVIHCLHRE